MNNDQDFLLRAIRDRRVELREMGLEAETDEVLQILSEILPDLPPEANFQTVAAAQSPADAPAAENAWGPENDGLRAAAVMPAEIERGQTADARLFIKNVSDDPIFLTVADRSGYDTASAVDPEGESLKVENELVYPMGFSGAIRPEIDPGLTAQRPATANLIRLKLEPGAIWEVKTKSALHYFKNDELRPEQTMQFGQRPKAQPAFATIFGDPTEALVTWELHTANGAEYADDLKSRIWPAKNGWSGLLHTAPVSVKLVEGQ
ncbi:MAG: hypothetical protein HKN23_06055 [Verrucomicrobiales bacterium]|nr:hypothetical protein [Verrucomicrobiales bacterium]